MATVRYTVINGQIVAEKRDGVRKFFSSDALGSTVALYSGLTKTDAFTYWPYGETRTRTGTTATKYKFAGTLGCREQADGGIYMQARVEQPKDGRWLTVDSLWPTKLPYDYADSNPSSWMDPTGDDILKWLLDLVGIKPGIGGGPIPREENLGVIGFPPGVITIKPCISTGLCWDCAAKIIAKHYPTLNHRCHPGFTHCMACCVLSAKVGRKCAEDMQNAQNDIVGLEPGRMPRCQSGIGGSGLGHGSVDINQCNKHCKAKWGQPAVKPYCLPLNRYPNPWPSDPC